MYLIVSYGLKYYPVTQIHMSLFQYPIVLGAGPQGVPGDSAYVYIAYASDAIGTGFTTTFNAALNFIAIKHTTVAIALPVVGDFVGLWFNYKGATGLAGANAYVYVAYASDDIGTGFTQVFNVALSWFAVKATTVAIPIPAVGDFAGLWQKFKADHAYLYVAYASDNMGTNFTNVFNAALDYIAVKPTTSPIAVPAVGDFVGLWKNYKGIQGIQGVPGTDPQCHSAAADPAVTDDSTSGYSINSLWWNTATHKLFSAESVGVGTATWHQIHPPLGADVSGQVGDAHTVDGSHSSAFVTHALASAVDDFLVGFGPGSYITKTLAQVKAILSLGTAAYTAATDYSVAANGVTNGDSHDHAGGDGAQVDHGGLGGLTHDDHTQYIKHDLATAINDFLVASGSGAYIKKTLAEVKVILGLGSAAYTTATDYAVAAKGVTNGDIHDHNGGDGSAIAAAATTFAATAKVLGRKAAGAGVGEECTLSEVLDFVGVPVRGGQLARGAAVWEQKAIGSYGQVWKSNGVDPEWGTMAGGINYCLNSDAGANVAGWATYDDGAVAVPINGIGGAPDSTWTRDTTITALKLPLRGVASFLWDAVAAADRQGEGVSYDFIIDPIDQTKMCRISFDSNQVITEGDFICYIFDVTNSVLIQPTPYKFPGTVADAKCSWSGEFQAAYNSVNYRFIMHRAIVTAQDFNLWFDNFKFGPQDMKQGVPVVDAAAKTMTITNITATIASFMGRMGQRARFEFKATVTNVATGNITLGLPAGMSIDTSVMPATPQCGVAQCYDATGNTYIGMIEVASATTLLIRSTGNAVAEYWDADEPMAAWANGDFIFGWFDVPILGWGSNCQVSSDAETRVVASKYQMSATTCNHNTLTVLNYGIKVYDTHNVVTVGAAWKFIAPMPGFYRVSIFALLNDTNSFNGTSENMDLCVYVNGAVQGNGYVGTKRPYANENYPSINGALTVFCNANDYIDTRLIQSSGANIPTFANIGEISIERISGPSQIAASEKVVEHFTNSAATAVANNTATKVPFATLVNSSHGAFVTDTFTCPKNGPVSIASACTLALTAAKKYEAWLAVYKNGAVLCYGTKESSTAQESGEVGVTVNVPAIQCIAGDTLSIYIFQHNEDDAAKALVATAAKNWISILQV
jgi:hypothetical protein